MFKLKKVTESLLIAFAGVAVSSTIVNAQETSNEEESDVERIAVVGSNIKRATDVGALPVTALYEQDIENTSAVTGDELLRSIPQIGEVNFGASTGNGGVNDARGDVASINLRGVGTGNTLTLLNGRRLVTHPGTQSENFVPVSTVNSNTLPVAGLRSLEILRDGAAAIYGSDAVAGVVNYALKDDYEGNSVSISHGFSEGTPLKETSFNYLTGFDLNQGKSHLTASLSYYTRDGMMASERPYSASHDLRNFPGLPEAFVGDTQLDNRSTSTPWGDFVSDSLGRFHLQPSTMDGCDFDLGSGICADSGSFPRELRFDRGTTRSLVSDVDRVNFYAYLTHDLGSGVEMFGETIYYRAEADRIREQAFTLSAQRFTVSADAFYNPFGENVTVRSYRPLDAGPREINVVDTSYRFLLGFRGDWKDWEWETAGFYTAAETNDSANRVNATLFQQAVNSTNQSTAYNIFAGGNLSNPNIGDSAPNSQAVIDSFSQIVRRDSETDLASIDFKASNYSIFELPAGDVGVAVGVEFRRETFEDDRDPLLDTSVPFVDQVTGVTLSDSNAIGSSPTPDSKGSRNVTSAYVEFIAPLLDSGDQYLELQLAARYENFSDVGSALKPKVALFWDAAEWISMRASYAGGFRAPGLPQVTAEGVPRSNNLYDPVRDVTEGIIDVRFGSTELEPEDDENTSFGVVIEPIDGLTITADWWKIKQENLVGILPGASHLLYDSLLRSQGSSNPAVIRDEATLDVIRIDNAYQNLDNRVISGIDVSVVYDLETSVGEFQFTANAAHLTKFDQEPSNIASILLQAQAEGNPAVPADRTVAGAGDLMKQNGRPEWRSRVSIDWNQDVWSAGVAVQYISEVVDTSTTATIDGEVIPLPVDSMTTLDAYVDYRFEQEGFLDGSKVRFTVRNFTDEEPPLADELAHGYFGALHSNRGRYFRLSFNKSF